MDRGHNAANRSVRTRHRRQRDVLICAGSIALSLGLSVLPGVAAARPEGIGRAAAVRDPTRGPDARALPRTSQAIGLPWAGRLRRGVRLRESDHLRYVGEYRAAGNFFGTWELVQLLERAAYRVAQRLPGAKLSVGELSRDQGGDIAGHSSHENGRDADVSFYLVDARGRPVEPWAFADVLADGHAPAPNVGMRFDDARNWELVAKLVADGDARVQYIFVHRTIKRRILAEGRRRGASRVLLDRAAQVMIEPADGHPHRNHFHVRVYCAPADRPGCRDRAPYWPWYPGAPPQR